MWGKIEGKRKEFRWKSRYFHRSDSGKNTVNWINADCIKSSNSSDIVISGLFRNLIIILILGDSCIPGCCGLVKSGTKVPYGFGMVGVLRHKWRS